MKGKKWINNNNWNNSYKSAPGRHLGPLRALGIYMYLCVKSQTSHQICCIVRCTIELHSIKQGEGFSLWSNKSDFCVLQVYSASEMFTCIPDIRPWHCGFLNTPSCFALIFSACFAPVSLGKWKMKQKWLYKLQASGWKEKTRWESRRRDRKQMRGETVAVWQSVVRHNKQHCVFI